MPNYIDSFIFPLPQKHLDTYQRVAEQVARIWKEHGATAYMEYVGDDLNRAGLRSFVDAVQAQEDEVVVFGWAVFPSKTIRDQANQSVPKDPRMAELVGPLFNPDALIFDASRMVYGGFRPLVVSPE